MSRQTWLELSTAHLDKDAMQALSAFAGHSGDYGWPALTIAPYGYGVFVTCICTELATDEQLDALPLSLRDCLFQAALEGCDGIRFDAEGDEIDELPTYEWS